MANGKSIFKWLICDNCGDKKPDTTGKDAADCPKCGSKRRLSDKWHVRVTQSGRTVTKAISTRKRDAEDWLSKCKVGSISAKENDVSWEQAIKNCAQWWKDAVKKGALRQSTADFYKFQIIALNDFFEGKSLLTITKGDIMDYQTFRSEEGLDPTTINHEVKALKRMYNMHVDRTSSEDSPRLCGKAMDIGRAALIKKDGQKVRFLSEKEIKILLDSATTQMVKVAILIGINTGLRRANVLELEWSEVRLSRRTIELPAAKMKSRHDHVVDIPAHLVQTLKEWRESNALSRYVFPEPKEILGKDGKIVDQPVRNFRAEWDKTIAACDMKGVGFHFLRHSYASHFLMDGGDLSTLSEILDHSDISITKRIYGHLSREHKRKASDEFADSFLCKFK